MHSTMPRASTTCSKFSSSCIIVPRLQPVMRLACLTSIVYSIAKLQDRLYRWGLWNLSRFPNLSVCHKLWLRINHIHNLWPMGHHSKSMCDPSSTITYLLGHGVHAQHSICHVKFCAPKACKHKRLYLYMWWLHIRWAIITTIHRNFFHRDQSMDYTNTCSLSQLV